MAEGTSDTMRAAAAAGEWAVVTDQLAERRSDLAPRELARVLCMAIDAGHLEIARGLLAAGADPNAHHTWTESEWGSLAEGEDAAELGEQFGPPLFNAARAGNLAAIDLLLENGADINLQTDASGRLGSAIDNAVGYGKIVGAQHLYERGARFGLMTLETACRSGLTKGVRTQMVEWLLDRGAEAQGSLLHNAVSMHDPELVEALLRRGMVDDVRDRDGRTALQRAEESLSRIRTLPDSTEWLSPAEKVVQALRNHHQGKTGALPPLDDTMSRSGGVAPGQPKEQVPRWVVHWAMLLLILLAAYIWGR